MFESIAQFIHRRRKLLIAGTVVGFVYLAVLDFSGADILGPFVLAWLWLFGITAFVSTFHPEIRAKNRGIYDWDAPAWIKGIFESPGYATVMKVFYSFYFVTLGFATHRFI